jgi:hypothetical protein
MVTNTTRLAISQPCDLAVNSIINQVKDAGLTVLRTFDMQLGHGAQAACPCPMHGSEPCNCQVVVLLIYIEAGEPVTLVAHGDDHETFFSIVDTPQQRPDANTEALIRNCFAHQEIGS